MKYTYEFSNEENIIEINKYWLDVLTDLDKAEGANQKKESRRHIFIQANSSKAERDTTKNIKRTSYIYKLNMPVICSECSGQMRRTHHPKLAITERWICTECGQSIGIFDEELISKITDNLNYLIHNPTLIKSNS